MVRNVLKKISKYIIAFSLMLMCAFTIARAADSNLVLSLVEETELYVKFTWTGVPSKTTDIYMMVSKDGGTFEVYATMNKAIDYYLMQKPVADPLNNDSGLRYYKIICKSGTTTLAESNVKTYDPSKLNLTPAVPDIKDITYSDGKLTVSWNPFYYTDSEGDLVAVMDKERITYQMLVTKDIGVLNLYSNIANNLNYSSLVECDPEIVDSQETGTSVIDLYWQSTVDSGVTKTYNQTFKSYTFSSEPLQKNTVYYVRLMGMMESNTTTLKSDPRVMAFYITTDGVLTVPAVMPKPPLKVNDTTTTTIELEWKDSWCELTNDKEESSTSWSNRLWLIPSKTDSEDWKVLLSEPTSSELASYTDNYDIDKLEVYDLSNDINYEKNHLAETYSIDLYKGSEYFIREVGYEDDYFYEITHLEEIEVQDELKDHGWSDNAVGNENLLDYINTLSNLPWVSYDLSMLTKDEEGNITCIYDNGLSSNTPYRVFIRVYRIDENGNRVYATRPSSIAATTKAEGAIVEPVPTVPTLTVVELSDIYTKIKWRYNSELYYELKYSEQDDITTAETITITNEMLNAEDAITDDGYYTYKLENLYPNTRYYVWVCAKQVIGTLVSAWSNPLTFKTTEILPSPIYPPSGIGVASEKEAITDDHITVEWTRNEEDYELDEYEGEIILKNLSYICEIANNIKFFDSSTIECGALDGDAATNSDFIIYSKNEFRALNLKSNSRYYVRIKTRITVRDTVNDRECYKDSAWSIIKIFKTSSINEYDSDYGDIEIPLAEKTETVYSGNNVRINILNDDRVINDMIEQNEYEYTFDFTNEKDSYTNREAYIPINVLETMQNRDMYIVMKSDDCTYRVDAKAFKNLDFQNLKRQGGVTGLVLSLDDDNSIYTTRVLSKNIGAYFNTRYGDSATTYLEDYIEVLFNTQNARYTSKTKAKGVIYDSKTRTWKDASEYYELGYNLILKTGKTGKVGLSY